jgi:hypothetical protein
LVEVEECKKTVVCDTNISTVAHVWGLALISLQSYRILGTAFFLPVGFASFAIEEEQISMRHFHFSTTPAVGCTLIRSSDRGLLLVLGQLGLL